MNTQIFIVSYKRDFRYLVYCLRSIRKFASGFGGTVLLVPCRDFDEAVELVRKENPDVTVRCGDEWPEKGMLWHMTQKCRADELCPQADIVLHIDSDFVFTEPVTPADYVRDGKPLLLMESFHFLCDVKKHEEVRRWQTATQNCLPFRVNYETMRAPGMAYHRALYPRVRAMVSEHVKQPFDDYVRSGHNHFPQLFAEHVTLGNVALHEFPNDYAIVDLEKEPWPPKKIHQAWSHRPPTSEDMALYRKLGLA